VFTFRHQTGLDLVASALEIYMRIVYALYHVLQVSHYQQRQVSFEKGFSTFSHFWLV